ncbi:peptidase domain-containing ABC transporter [Nocardia sp. NPDC004168]|uniref:peptidase domain-containing ABC transporter n=1 Tax=Nocardia sp. NPDC004168 TaxID=3154452 RepID=UPI00339E6441
MSGDSERATITDGWDDSGRFRRHATDKGGRIGHFGSPTFIQGQDPVERATMGFRRGVRSVIPESRQVGEVDCGPASLRMALASRGIDVPLEQLRRETGSGRNGTSAAALLRVARLHGMDGRGVRSNLAGLRHLATGSILFWRFNHFVVLEGANRSHVVLLDPAVGRRQVPWSEVDEEFTGVALEFAAAPVVRANSRRPGWRRVVGELETASWIVPRTAKWVSALAASAALLIFNLAYPYVLGKIVPLAAGNEISEPGAELRYGAVLAAAVMSYGLLHLVRSRLIVTIQSLVEARTAETLAARITRLPLDFFLGRHPGDLAMRIRSAGRFKQVVSVTTLGAAFDAVLIMGYLLVVGARDFVLGAVAATGVLAFALGLAATWKRQRELSVAACAAQVESTNVVHEMLSNMTTVKALGAEGAVHARWLNVFSGELTTGTRKRRHAGSISVFVSTLQFATPLTVLFTGVLTASGDRTGLTDAVMLSAVSAGLFVSLANLSVAVAALVDLAPDLLRINDVLDSAEEPSGGRHFARPERAVSVRLDGVSFAYPGNPSETIREVGLDIAPGATTVIVGKSGCGKSTLGMLIAGLLSPIGGRVLVDDVDLAHLDRPAYRRHIGYVDQNSSLMAGSILDNIRLGDECASLADVRRAARIAQIDEFIGKLPMKYETMLGAGGGGISGGQRQRIALARALVKNPRLLVLDEATSAVDPVTEQAIFGQLASTETTVVVLGHRVPPQCDGCHVVVIENGRVGTTRNSV